MKKMLLVLVSEEGILLRKLSQVGSLYKRQEEKDLSQKKMLLVLVSEESILLQKLLQMGSVYKRKEDNNLSQKNAIGLSI